MKLQTKIQLFSGLFMLVLIVLINTAIYFLFYKISTDSELEQLTAHTDTIVSELNAHPDIAEGELLKAYLPNDGMIRVIGKDSKPIITLTMKDEYRKLNSAYVTSESKLINKTLADENIAVISKPIIWENGDIVTLQVSKHLVVLDKNMTTLFYVMTVASFLMLIPTIMAANVLSRFLLQPIKSLIQAMKENMEHSQWKKIDVLNKSKDELYEMEKTYNDMIDHLEENFRKQEIFVSDASHELKTPISIVKSYAQLLGRRGMENPELFSESVAAIESEADRMQNLVEQMLLLAKNQETSEMQEVDFTAICTAVVKKFQGAYQRDIIFSKTPDIIVRGNKDQLQQIVYILIDNALKYSDGAVELDLNPKQNEAIFHVKDHGQGIPEAEQEQIFDRFYRMDKARSRETGGTGLGLPIAKAITEVHHGELSVMSRAGKGSTFTLKLPIISN